MSAEKLIDRLDGLGLLEEKVISDLRKQVAESRFAITPDAVVKLLVENGHLTSFQARKLVADITSDEDEEEERKPQSGSTPSKGSSATRAKPAPRPADSELDLAPF